VPQQYSRLLCAAITLVVWSQRLPGSPRSLGGAAALGDSAASLGTVTRWQRRHSCKLLPQGPPPPRRWPRRPAGAKPLSCWVRVGAYAPAASARAGRAGLRRPAGGMRQAHRRPTVHAGPLPPAPPPPQRKAGLCAAACAGRVGPRWTHARCMG
jgi:hypothetical protein